MGLPLRHFDNYTYEMLCWLVILLRVAQRTPGKPLLHLSVQHTFFLIIVQQSGQRGCSRSPRTTCPKRPPSTSSGSSLSIRKNFFLVGVCVCGFVCLWQQQQNSTESFFFLSMWCSIQYPQISYGQEKRQQKKVQIYQKDMGAYNTT